MNFRFPISDFRLTRAALLSVLAALLFFTNAVFAEETLAERRARVAAMSPEEKAKLQQRWERYQRMSSAEQEKLKRLHEALSADKDEAALRRVMQRYAQWQGKQGAAVTAQLVEADPRRRVTLVKRYASKVSKEDLATANEWLRQVIVKHEPQIIAAFPEKQRPMLWAALPQHDSRSREQRTMWFWAMMLSWNTDFWKNAPFDDLDLVPLGAELSPPARRWLEHESPSDQALTVCTWVRGDSARPMWGPGGPRIDEEHLLKLFEELPEETRDGLLRLSSDELLKSLRDIAQRRGRPPGPGRGEPGGFKGPGGPRLDGPMSGDGKPPRPPGGRPPGDSRPEPGRSDRPPPAPPPE